MISPGFLEHPEVRQLLNGIEPAWTRGLALMASMPFATSLSPIYVKSNLIEADLGIGGHRQYATAPSTSSRELDERLQ
jgi:hypothetical protein